MGKTLIITEKPSVAREYAQILNVRGGGNGVIQNDRYVITWCVGHLVEMAYPEMYDSRYKTWNIADLPFLPKEYKYDVIPAVKQQYQIVNRWMNSDQISEILYAGDSGREGQVIIELIRRHGGVGREITEKRVWIDSFTEDEIMRGIKTAKPMEEYDNLANAGILRGIEDYAMGINFSRALSIKFGRMLNRAADNDKYAAIAIGRVMTCVLGMVVKREREIREFTETPFFRITADLMDKENGISVEWKAVEGSEFFESPKLYKDNGFKSEKDADAFVEKLKKTERATIKEIKKSLEKKKPPLLFNLAELQAECSKRFKISPDETLKAVQELYEKKLTTYPRTDARVLSTAIAGEIDKNISGLVNYKPTEEFTRKIIDEKLFQGIIKSQYTDDKKITDHYAIIPTGQTGALSHMSSIQRKVYDLIVRRFLSIFYPPSVHQKIAVAVMLEGEEFSSSVKTMKDRGYLVISGNGEDERDNPLLEKIDSLKKNETVLIAGILKKEGKTSPPKRYTSGSMILAMENAGKLIEDEELRAQIKGAGIGTSATRAEIIDKLVRIGYLNLNGKTQVLTPEAFGEMIYEVVLVTMPSMLNPEMTASWEKGLAGVEKGKISVEKYRVTLEAYVRRYTENIIEADLLDYIAKRIEPFATGKGYEREGSSDRHEIGARCPICGAPVQTTPFGYGCSSYKETGCSFAIGLIAGKRISEKEAADLIEKGAISNVKGFKSKAGKYFSAGLKLEDDADGKKRIVFDFQ